MDQSTLDAEDSVEARHPSGTMRPMNAVLHAVAARPAVAELPSDAAFLADTMRPADGEHPEDAAGPTVNVQDPEGRAWPPAPHSHSHSRCQLLYGLGALVVVLLVSGLIAFFTLILTTQEKTPNLTGTHVHQTGCPNTTGQVRHVLSPGDPFF